MKDTRKVHLLGVLGEKFGEEFDVASDSMADICSIIEVNRPGFRKYLIDSAMNGKDIHIDHADIEFIEEDDLLVPLKQGDVTMALIPAGAGGSVGKIIKGIAVLAAVAVTGGGAVALTSFSSFASGITAATSMGGIKGFALGALRNYGVNMAVSGFKSILNDDPSNDLAEGEDYLFTGIGTNGGHGATLPILYGELRVPGQAIGIQISGKSSNYLTMTPNKRGDINLTRGGFS